MDNQNALRTRIYRSLDALPEPYTRLFAEATSRSFLLSLPWFRNLANTTLEEGASLWLYGVENAADNQPLVLLVGRCPAGQNGSVLEGKWIGRQTLASFSNHQSSFFSLLVASTCDDSTAAIHSLVSTIGSQQPRWTLMDFNLFDREEPLFTELIEALRSRRLVAVPYYYKGNWFENIETASFDQYVRSRPHPARKSIQNYERKQRKLQKAGRLKFDLITDTSRIEEGITAYNRVYAASWKKPELFPKFTEGLMRECARFGFLRLGLLFIDGQPAAVELAVVAAKKAIMLKTAYDPQFQKESAGSLAILNVVRYIVETDHVIEIDFGTDDDPYKKVWVSQRRERWGMLAFNPRTAVGALSFMQYVAATQLQKVTSSVKRGLMRFSNSIHKRTTTTDTRSKLER